MNFPEEFEERRVKTAMSRNPELARIVEELYVAHIGGGNLDSRVENLAQQLGNSAGLDEPRAQLLHPGHGCEIVGQARIEGPDGFLGPLLFCNIAGDLRGPDNLASLIADRRDRQRNIQQTVRPCAAASSRNGRRAPRVAGARVYPALLRACPSEPRP